MATYYTTLGIDEDATTAQVKKAYRTLAKKYHPDLNSSDNAEEKFIEVGVAYSCLSKDDSRQAYNRLLRYERNNLSKPNVKRKYQNDVDKRTRRGRQNANVHSRMSYNQYQRDELLRTSFSALIIKTIVTLIIGVVLAFVLYNIAIKLYGIDTRKWTEYRSIYVLGGTYIFALIGLSYIYEPLIKNLIIGKPKRSK